MIIIQGVRGPYGATMENEDVSSVLYEIELAERAFKGPSVSKMWQRALLRLFEFIYSKGLMILIMIFFGYFIAQAMLAG